MSLMWYQRTQDVLEYANIEYYKLILYNKKRLINKKTLNIIVHI